MTYEELKNISDKTLVKYSVDEGPSAIGRTLAFGYIKDMIFVPFFLVYDYHPLLLHEWKISNYFAYSVITESEAMLIMLEH